MATLFGLGPSEVAQDESGNIQPGKSASVYTAYAGGTFYTQTYSVSRDSLLQGGATGGIVAADALGRVAFYADTTDTLWLDWGNGTRWPINPAKAADVVVPQVEAANASQVALIGTLQGSVDELKAAPKFTTLPPFGDMPHPYVSAHRGGTFIVPEGTRLGRLNAYGLGMQVVDGGDIHATLDGVLYDCHDSTLDRTTNLSGPIAALPSMRVMQGKIDCSQWFGGGWADQPITSIIDTLDDLGGKVYITLEVKSDVDPKYAQKIVDLIKGRGLTKQILIASFDESLLAPAIEAGHEVMLLGTTGTTVASDAGLVGRGVNYFGGSVDMTPATAKAIADHGVRVVVYSIDQHYRIDQFRTGASGELWGYIANDPLYIRGHVDGTYDYRLTSDPFDSLTYYHGHQPDNGDYSPASRGTFLADAGGAYFCIPVATQRRAVLQGWASPLVNPNSYTITYEQGFTSTVSGQAASLVFGCPTDAPFTGDDSAGGGIGDAPGYLALFSGTGLLRLFRRDPGTPPVQLASIDVDPNPAWAPGVNVPLKVTVSGSTITLTKTDTGESVSANDGTYRGGYVHLLANNFGAQSGARWRNITVS